MQLIKPRAAMVYSARTALDAHGLHKDHVGTFIQQDNDRSQPSHQACIKPISRIDVKLSLEKPILLACHKRGQSPRKPDRKHHAAAQLVPTAAEQGPCSPWWKLSFPAGKAGRLRIAATRRLYSFMVDCKREHLVTDIASAAIKNEFHRCCIT
jgi:hypothetical protein